MKKILLLMASCFVGLWSYAQNTNLVWAKNIKASIVSQEGVSREIVMDNVGNYYIAGYYSGKLDMDPGPGTSTLTTYGGNSDIFIAKYRNNGTFVWAKSMGTTADDAAFDLVISPSQKLYVCGYFSTATYMDIDPGPATYTLQGEQYGEASSFVASFDTSGVFQSGFSIPASHAHAIAVDNSENIHITGDYLGTVDFDPGPGTYNKTSVLSTPYSCWNIFYAKYSSAGAFQWVNVKGSSVAAAYTNRMYTEYGASIDVDDITGNVVMGGAFAYTPYTEIASSTGTVLKGFSFTNSTSNAGGAVTGALFDNSGNVYYSGNYMNPNDFNWSSTATFTLPTNASYKQGFVVKYDPALNFSWGRQIPPTMLGSANLEMSFDNNNDLLLVGIEQGSAVTSLLMAKIDKNNASIVWRNNMTGSCYNGSSDNHGYGIVYSPVDGNVLVTGTIGGSSVGSSTPCSFDADPGTGVFTLNTGVGNTANREIFMGKYGSCAGVPASLSAISGNPVQCQGSTTVYSVSPASGASSYNWSLPGGWTGSSTSNTISVTPSASGTISVYALNSCGSTSSQTLSVQVNPVPVQPSAISGVAALCAGSGLQTYSVPAVSGATSYSWSLPGSWSGSSTSNTIQVNPGTSGGTIMLLAGNACGTSPSQSLAVTVNALPVVSISGLSSVCSGGTATLNAGGAISYTWSTLSNSSTIMVSPSSTTVYTLTGTDANGCTNSTTKSITVNALPAVAISGPATLCYGSSATLTASGADTYTWSTTSNNTSVVISPTVTTSYTLTGTDANGCVNVAAKSVTVHASPAVIIGGNTAICAGTNATLTVTGAISYTWSTGATTSSVSVSPPSSITYSVLGIDANGCQGVAFANVGVTASLPVIVNGPSMVCAGSSATLDATGAMTYTWSTGATSSSVSVSPTAFTIYTVTGTDAAGCTGTAYKNITVVANPTLSVMGPSTVCAGASATIQVSGALSYTWSTGAHASYQVITPFADITYYVYGTDANGCMGGATKSITVSALPAVSVSGPSSVCIGSSISLGTVGAATYTWNTGSNANSISVSPTVTTTYTLSGTSANTCSNTAVRSITVNPLPVVAVSGPTLICKGNTATLTASGANSYTWNTSSNSATVSVSPVLTTTYTVNGTDLNGCSKAASLTLSVSPCTGIESWSREATGISLYPNPARDEVFIQSNLAIQAYSILDVSGRSVFEASGLNTDKAQLNLRSYDSGIYMILIYAGNSTTALKFIKE